MLQELRAALTRIRSAGKNHWLAPLWKSAGRKAVRSRLPGLVPACVEYPLDVLRELRGVHRDIDALILPHGEIWIVQWREDVPRVLEGRKALCDAKVQECQPDRTEILQAAGYELLIVTGGQRGLSAGHLIPILSRQMTVTASDLRGKMRANRDEVNGINDAKRREAVLRDRIRSNSNSDWRWAHRGRRGFSYHKAYEQQAANFGST